MALKRSQLIDLLLVPMILVALAELCTWRSLSVSIADAAGTHSSLGAEVSANGNGPFTVLETHRAALFLGTDS
jgi:hypothetical protein